jgi:dihydrofolate synthase/folylpolyglutamate synthase
VSVITSVGLDHVVSLGPTLADIAWHKAGIIKPGAPAVIGDVPTEALAVIRAAAQSAGVELIRAVDASVPSSATHAMPGRFQQANARCAIAAIEALRRRGLTIPDAAILAGLASARIPARLERMPGGNLPAIWLDGAHNSDKIAALAEETDQLRAGSPLTVLVLGVLGTKDASAIVERIAPSASAIVATEPSVHGKRSLNALELARVVCGSSFKGELLVEPDPSSALDCAETLARSRGADVLVTGSLYLAGQMRRHWFPDAEIIVQRTPWPKT